MPDTFMPIEDAARGKWLSVSMAAHVLGVSADTVRRWVDDGKLRAERTVLGRVIDPAAVQALLEERSSA